MGRCTKPEPRGFEFYTDATIGHPMPPERSADVDTALDLGWCEVLFSFQS